MRPCPPLLVLILAGLAPLAARAQVTQDRYDAPSPEAPLPAVGASLRGPQGAGPVRQTYLTWTGKTAGLRGSESEDSGLRGPAPLDNSMGAAVRNANPGRSPAYASAATPAAYTQPQGYAPQSSAPQGAATTQRPAPQNAATQPAPRTAQTPRAAPAAQAATPQGLPSSLYDRGYVAPAAQPAAQAAQAAPLAGAPPRPSPPQVAAAQPAPAPSQGQDQSGQAASDTRPHYYSLVRDYGLQPDPIPPAAPSVLELGPTVAQAMADNGPDNSPTIDLAGQDQAAVGEPERQHNYTTSTGGSSAGTTTTSSNGQTSTTYTINR